MLNSMSSRRWCKRHISSILMPSQSLSQSSSQFPSEVCLFLIPEYPTKGGYKSICCQQDAVSLREVLTLPLNLLSWKQGNNISFSYTSLCLGCLDKNSSRDSLSTCLCYCFSPLFCCFFFFFFFEERYAVLFQDRHQLRMNGEKMRVMQSNNNVTGIMSQEYKKSDRQKKSDASLASFSWETSSHLLFLTQSWRVIIPATSFIEDARRLNTIGYAV